MTGDVVPEDARAEAAEAAPRCGRLWTADALASPRKPPRLRPGDLVAVVSPSWGGPAAFPATYAAGLATLAGLGLRVREYPGTRAVNASVAARVADLHAAFDDDEVAAIVLSIGGEDSVRLLPFLDPVRLARRPKVVMGYSDGCTLLTYLRALGHVAFHGPAVMAGFAQASNYPAAFVAQLRALLFDAAPVFEYPVFGVRADGYADWADPANAARTKRLLADAGPRTLQGTGTRRGRLWGGCLEVLEMLKGTPWWPPAPAWRDVVLLIEGSEEAPPPALYRRVLRSWAAAGALESVAAVLVGYPAGYDAARRAALDAELRRTLADECGIADVPTLVDCAFGHTDPQWLLPLGCTVVVDAERSRVTLVEAAVL